MSQAILAGTIMPIQKLNSELGTPASAMMATWGNALARFEVSVLYCELLPGFYLCLLLIQGTILLSM